MRLSFFAQIELEIVMLAGTKGKNSGLDCHCSILSGTARGRLILLIAIIPPTYPGYPVYLSRLSRHLRRIMTPSPKTTMAIPNQRINVTDWIFAEAAATYGPAASSAY